MRLWSIHPKYLDAKGLVALWREALLAKAVLSGNTRGYTQHPQLHRFRASDEPLALIDAYLLEVWKESRERQYSFDDRKLRSPEDVRYVPVARGQLSFELEHLRRKLAMRNGAWLVRIAGAEVPDPHPVFRAVEGPVEQWEREAHARSRVTRR